jgi:predicted nucleotidyltransferase component of viral defense system
MSVSSESTVCREKTSYMTEQYSENNNDITININDNNNDHVNVNENINIIKREFIKFFCCTILVILISLFIVSIYAYLA